MAGKVKSNGWFSVAGWAGSAVSGAADASIDAIRKAMPELSAELSLTLHTMIWGREMISPLHQAAFNLKKTLDQILSEGKQISRDTLLKARSDLETIAQQVSLLAPAKPLFESSGSSGSDSEEDDAAIAKREPNSQPTLDRINEFKSTIEMVQDLLVDKLQTQVSKYSFSEDDLEALSGASAFSASLLPDISGILPKVKQELAAAPPASLVAMKETLKKAAAKEHFSLSDIRNDLEALERNIQSYYQFRASDETQSFYQDYLRAIDALKGPSSSKSPLELCRDLEKMVEKDIEERSGALGKIIQIFDQKLAQLNATDPLVDQARDTLEELMRAHKQRKEMGGIKERLIGCLQKLDKQAASLFDKKKYPNLEESGLTPADLNAGPLIEALRDGDNLNEALISALKSFKSKLERLQNAQQGFFPRSATELNRKLDQALDRVDDSVQPLVDRFDGLMYKFDRLLGALGAGEIPAKDKGKGPLEIEAPGADAPEVDESNIQNWSNWLKEKALFAAREVLTNCQDWAIVAAASGITSLFRVGRSVIEGSKIPQSEKNQALHTFDTIIERLQRHETNLPSWIEALQSLPGLLNQLPNTSFSGLTLPLFSEDVSETSAKKLYDMIERLRPIVPQDEEESDAKINIPEKDKTDFYLSQAKAIGSLWSLHFVVEKLFGWMGDSKFEANDTFATIMNRIPKFPEITDTNKKKAIAVMKKAFMAELKKVIHDRSAVNPFIRFVTSSFILPVTSWFINVAIKHYSKAVNDLAEDLIQTYAPNHQTPKFLEALKPITNALIQYKSIHRHFGNDPNLSINLEDFIDLALEHPENLQNGDSRTKPAKEITQKATEIIMDHYFPPLDIASKVGNAVTKIYTWANRDILDVNAGASKELNNALKVLKWTISIGPQTVLFFSYIGAKLVEVTLSKIFKWAAKKALVKSGGIGTLLDLTKNSLYGQSHYAHAINTVFLDVLNEACNALINRDNSSNADAEKLADSIEAPLRELVENAMEIFDLRNRRMTQQGIKDYFDNNGGGLKQAVEEHYLPAFISNIVKILNTSSKQLLAPDSSRNHYNKLLMLVGESLTKENKAITEEDVATFKATEVQIQEKLRFLLEFTIHESVHGELANYAQKPKEAAEEYVLWIRENLNGSKNNPGFVGIVEKLLMSETHLDDFKPVISDATRINGEWLSRVQSLSSKLAGSSRARLEKLIQGPLQIFASLQDALCNWYYEKEELTLTENVIETLQAIQQSHSYIKEVSEGESPEIYIDQMIREAEGLTRIALSPEILAHAKFKKAGDLLKFMRAFRKESRTNLTQIRNLKSQFATQAVYDKLLKVQDSGKSLIQELQEAAAHYQETNKLFFRGRAEKELFDNKAEEIKRLIKDLPDIQKSSLEALINANDADKLKGLQAKIAEYSQSCQASIDGIRNTLTFDDLLKTSKKLIKTFTKRASSNKEKVDGAQQDTKSHLNQLQRALVGVSIVNRQMNHGAQTIEGILEDLSHPATALEHLRQHQASVKLTELRHTLTPQLEALNKCDSYNFQQKQLKEHLDEFFNDIENILAFLDANDREDVAPRELRLKISSLCDSFKRKLELIKLIKDDVTNLRMEGLKKIRQEAIKLKNALEKGTDLELANWSNPLFTDTMRALDEEILLCLDSTEELTVQEAEYRHSVESVLQGFRRIHSKGDIGSIDLDSFINSLDTVITEYAHHNGFDVLPWVNIEITKWLGPIINFVENKIRTDTEERAGALKKLAATPSAFKTLCLQYLRSVIDSHA